MVENEPIDECLLGSDVLQIPRALITEAEVFHNVVSYATWQNELTEHEKQHVMKFLPTSLAGENHEACLRDLFNGSNFKFGNPLSQFQMKLGGGMFDPSASKCRAMCLKEKQKQHKLRMQQYHTRLLEQLIMLQQIYVDEALRTSSKQQFCERLSTKSWQAACKQHMQSLDFNDVKTISRAARLRRYRILQEVKEETGCIDSSSGDEDVLMDQTEPFHADGYLNSKQYMHILRRHRKRRQRREASPSLETQTISSVQDVMGRVFMTKVRKASCENSVTSSTQRLNAQKLNSLSAPTKDTLSPRQAMTAKKHKRRLTKPLPFNDDGHAITVRQIITGGSNELAGGEIISDAVALPGIIGDDWDLDANGLDSKHISGTDPVGLHHEDFFDLLGQIVRSFPNSRASTQKIEERVREWQEAIAASKASDPASAACGSFKWYADGGSPTNWIELVQPALKYLAGDTATGVPYDGTFVPLVDYKERLQLWRWLGIESMASAWQRRQHTPGKPAAGLDGVGDDDDDMVVETGADGSYRRSLWAHWLDNRAAIVASAKEGCHGGRQREPTPPSRVKTTYVVKPSSDDERAAFRKQELERFANPRRSFTYLVNGYDAVVGPVKGVYDKSIGTAGGSGNKAREHALLISERPSYVTILTLVRDAAARLPNGEGTRSDICELLKDSQYLADGVTESQINTVVSGALDRLHYEKDPCVKYDVVKKLWIYLHRNRSEDEFERIHEVQGAVVKAKKAHVKPKSGGGKRLRTATGASAFLAADGLLDNSGGADDVGMDADLDEPPTSPLALLLPVDSPPVPQLPTPSGHGLPPSPASSAAASAGSSSPGGAVLPARRRSATPSVPAPSSTTVGGQQSLISRLVVAGGGSARPQAAGQPLLMAAAAEQPVSALAGEGRSSSAGVGASAASQQQQQQQQAQPRTVSAATATTTAATTSSAPVVGAVRLATAAAAAAAAATAAAQQHYTFSLVPSASVGGSGGGSSSMVVPLAKTAAPGASTLATVRAVSRSGAAVAAAAGGVLEAAAATVSSPLLPAPTLPAVVGGSAASVVVQQRRRGGSGMRHVMIRQQLPGDVSTATPPASPPVVASGGQIRLRLEQPISLVAPALAARPGAGSVVLQPAVPPGAALDKSTAASTAPATSAVAPVVLTVRDGSSPATAGAVGSSIVGSKQVFSQKAPGIPGTTVLQKIVTAVPQLSGKTSTVVPSVAVMHSAGGQAAAGTAQMVARIVQNAASAATTGGGAQGSAGRVVQQLMSAVPGSTLTLPAATFTRSLTTASSSVAPGTTFKLVAAPQAVTVSNAVGAVAGTTLVKPGMAAALLAEKCAKVQATADAARRPASAHVVLAAPSPHQLAEGNVPQRIFLSPAARSPAALTTAVSAQKAVGTVTVAAGGTASPSSSGQLITTYYTTTSTGAGTASPAAFILTKPITTAPASTTAPVSAVLGTQQVAYSLAADGSTKGKTMVYGRLISNAVHVGQPQQQMVITRPTTVSGAPGHHPTTTVIVSQSSVTKNDSLIIVPVKKAPPEKVVATPDGSR